MIRKVEVQLSPPSSELAVALRAAASLVVLSRGFPARPRTSQTKHALLQASWSRSELPSSVHQKDAAGPG